ncbi:MAG: hypothetical protein M3R70_02835, partial [Actinomycetota bacterium]|nr:hypothetical protein [Actinomycetota bacterium]
ALLALAAAGVVPGSKLLVRNLRYLTRDPRRIASASVRELADLLADQRVQVRKGMSVGQIAAAAEAELGLEASSFANAASAARYGPEAEAPGAAERARAELKGLRAQLAGYLAGGERLRGLWSVRSLGLK